MEHTPVEQPVNALIKPERNYDVNYIEKALAKAYESPNLQVESFNIEPLVQNGENFSSVIYRLKVSYRKSEHEPLESVQLILKDLLPMMAELGSNEKVMFEHILPAMANIFEKAAPSLGERKLSAKCLFTENGEAKEVYLMEDLCELGYGLFDRQNGLSLEEAGICLRKMAQFHAAGMLLLHADPKMVAELSTSHYAKHLNDDPLTNVIVVGGVNYAVNVIAEFPGMSSIAAKMKAQIPDEYLTRMRDIVDPKNSAIQVIVHGDLWVNNMMVNMKDKKAVVVDFQNCFVGSPAIDIQFLFYTSLQLGVLLEHQNELLKDYYQSLCDTLTACNYAGSMPSFEQLLDEMQRCLFYGYYAVVCELPICCVSKEASEDFTFSTFGDDETLLAKRKELYANKRVLETLKATLGNFEKEGILETLK